MFINTLANIVTTSTLDTKKNAKLILLWKATPKTLLFFLGGGGEL